MHHRILITGATNMIGSHLVTENLDRGNQVRVLINHGNPEYALLKKRKIEVMSGDIQDEKTVLSAVSNIDIVYNCIGEYNGWLSHKEIQDITVKGTRELFKACAKENVNRVIHLSTSDVFGYGLTGTIDESSPKQAWNEPYPDYRLKADEIADLFRREQRLPITIIYPCRVIGENDFSFLANLAVLIKTSRMRFWRKTMRLYPVAVGNLVDLMITAGTHRDAEREDFIIHDGNPITLQEICGIIAETLGYPNISKRISYTRALLSARLHRRFSKSTGQKTGPHFTPHFVKCFKTGPSISASKAEELLNWKPPFSTEEGLTRTMTWLSQIDYETLKDNLLPLR